MNVEELKRDFFSRYNKPPEHVFFCPGRINLIGEHIDYNGGNVMPCAISLGTYLIVAKNTDKKLRFDCLNFPETAELHLQNSYSKTGKEWFNYPLGVISNLLNTETSFSGLDMLFYGNLPIGAGLSSSASIEVLTAFAMSEIFQLNLSTLDITLLAKKVENEFIGVNCGVMDQFAVAFGKKDKAILLNCDTLDYEYIPFEIGNNVLAIINSNKQRTLADSKYNERFAQCREALKRLEPELQVNHLCEIDSATFEANRQLINDPVLENRALHVITENERVQAATKALNSGDITQLGKLMYASHESLKSLYDVSGKELDTIVEFASSYPGCIGARMTGAGFGGCAIALVQKDKFDDFAAGITTYYKDKIGYEPGVFASAIGDGVMEIK
jgi:galactokinase